jgi:hypothetical protein
MPRVANHVIRRREIAIYKTALHRAGIKRLPTLASLHMRGIIKPVGRGAYTLCRKRKRMGAV